MPSLEEFATADATAQAEWVRRKEVKPIELVEAAIARVKRLNPKLIAVVTLMFGKGRAAAPSLPIVNPGQPSGVRIVEGS